MKNLILIVILLITSVSQAQFNRNNPEYQPLRGFFKCFYDPSSDKLYMEVNKLDQEFLYVNSLSNGIGSNDLGLDRGQLGNERVVSFKKMGNKLFLIQPNLQYRALTENRLEKASVEQAFAKSVLFGFPIVEQYKGSYIIDLTPFVFQDSHEVAQTLRATQQGSYQLDISKSALNMERTKDFPKNLEVDVMLTFSGKSEGYNVNSVVPTSSLITVAMHHSFVELPDTDFVMREFDTRSGSYPFSYMDYATPVEQSIVKRYITRHRLQKKDPKAAISEPVEPIIYYLDNGTPEPVRSALLEGGSWWNQAFESIGYKNAFQIKMLPDDADPLDVRYNVIQWVHRSTRGWSYGSSVTDPRTGEILKGHVSLGSLRIRQDFMIAQALTNAPFKESDDNNQEMLNLALARIRQLAAHEIGHTLGFAHNYSASTAGKISVMDYPHPQMNIVNEQIDYSKAYEVGIGAWDKVSVAYSYSDFGMDESKVKPQLNAILENAKSQGLTYITDQDARPAGSAHAKSHLWDNGMDVIDELNQMLKVRTLAINQFSEDNIKSNEPFSVLEDVFVPLYFYHRYQSEAVAKVVGGMLFDYQVKGSNQDPVETVDFATQKRALKMLLRTLDASEIAVPKNKLHLFPPRAFGYPRNRESIMSRTGVSFDPLSAAETAADNTLMYLLNPQRASRLIGQKALDSHQLGLEDILESVIENTLLKSFKDSYLNEVNNVISNRVLDYLMDLVRNTNTLSQVNAIALYKLHELDATLGKKPSTIQNQYLRYRIQSFFEHQYDYQLPTVLKIPDGSPIGTDCF